MSVAIIMLFLLVLLALVLVYLQQTQPNLLAGASSVKSSTEGFGDWWGPWMGPWWNSGGVGAQSFYGRNPTQPSGCSRPTF